MRRHFFSEVNRMTVMSKEEQDDFMRAVASGLDDVFNKGWREGGERKIGFVLLTYEFGEHIEGTNRVNYIGNGARPDVLVALKEVIARWEGKYVETPQEGKPS